MYIKEIKLNSFKSFADKINIELNPTFTGIVGPNGSGKSNIVDAIKWVLGEQSVKALRGSSGMTDVIFAGSKSRNSSNQASVTVVFDNTDRTLPTDFNEVAIKRVVSKLGENEYYLNNTKCKLKDISDLLLDSFSSKESFNIIPQNKIEEILSDKPEDRRVIFEDAAGVLKYKRRKEETLKKLAKTDENLERVNMIISELETQVKVLEVDSKKAVEYKKNKEELESIDVALMTKDIIQFNELLNSKKEAKEKLELDLIGSQNSSSSENVEIEKMKLEILTLEEQIKSQREKYIKLKENLSELLSKKELSIERNKYDKSSDEVKVKLVELKEQELKLNNDIKMLENEINNLKLNEENLLKTLNKSNETNSSINEELLAEKNNYSNLKRKEFEINGKLSVLESNLENMDKLPYSVKAILSNPSLNGINNIIGNIVDTKEEYRTMLDISLGSSSNFIIVDDEGSAKEAIEYLKRNNKGRATFFPLSVIKPKSIEPDVLNIAASIKGFVSVASDLVKYESKYYNIIMNQLGNIIVADNINSALIISKKINYRYRVVTLDGEIFHVGGSLSGGSLKTSNSYISDKYEIDKLKVLLEHVTNNIKDSEKKINVINDKYINSQEEGIKCNLDLVKIKEIINSKESAISDLKIESSRKSSEIQDLGGEKNTELDKIIDEYYNLDGICNDLESNISSLESTKRKITEDVFEKESIQRKNNSLYNEISTKINSIEIDLVKLNLALDSLLNRLSEEYNLTYEGAKNRYTLEIEEKEARLKVSELKKILKSIGNVNLGSIEEFERINKRYLFLTNQKNDLIQSEKDLLEIISGMDTTMISKFEKTFNSINSEFSKVFSKLFGGGSASLNLTNPDDLLETGIEIIATPPGKSMKPISLLSGGEKTLTAISLLFAIMNLKNVPFVILDEVESALDDINAEKFGEYLSNYRNKTQLLIITHKKKTMEYVDLLYGVTMQESGVSKMVSVKLENIN